MPRKATPRTGSARRGLTVVQAVRSWLPQTQSWLHVQLAHADVRSVVLCDATENLDQFPMAEVLRTPRRRSGLLARWSNGRRLRQMVRGVAPDAIHSHFGNHAWRIHSGVRRLGVPHVVSFYGHDATRLPQAEPAWRDRYRDLLPEAAAVLAEGPHMAATLRSLGAPAATTRVHPLGVDLARLPFRPRRRPAGREPLRILMAGRFVEKKGFVDGIRAVAALAREAPAELTLVGDASEEPRSQAELGRIEEALRDTGLPVRRPGLLPYDALLEEAGRHHVFLAPSFTAADGDAEGGAPVSLIEMAAAGMAIVATRHCDIPFVLPAEAAPFLANERDVAGLHRALRTLLDADWPGLLAAQRRHVETRFDARLQGKALAAIYRSVAGSLG